MAEEEDKKTPESRPKPVPVRILRRSDTGMRPAPHRSAGRLGESVAAARVPKHLRAATRLAADAPSLPAPGPVPRPAPRRRLLGVRVAPSGSGARARSAARARRGEREAMEHPGHEQFAAEWMFGDQKKALSMGVRSRRRWGG